MEQNIMKDEIQRAVEVLRKGGIILYPTDTVWGIGCDATSEAAVEKIYALKKRTDSKSMLVLVDSLNRLERYVQKVPDIAYDLLEVADKPTTIIYANGINLAANLLADDGSVGVRVVRHDFCEQLIRAFNRPLVSTSANITDTKTPSVYEQISKEIIGGVDFAVNRQFEGKSTHKPSSIIKLGAGGQIQIIRN